MVIVLVEVVAVIDEDLDIFNELLLKLRLDSQQVARHLRSLSIQALPGVAQSVAALRLLSHHGQLVLVQHGVGFLRSQKQAGMKEGRDTNFASSLSQFCRGTSPSRIQLYNLNLFSLL